MKKTTDKTMRLFLILLAIALVISVGIAHVSAAMGYLGKATLVKGHPEILGVKSENPQITFLAGEEDLGRVANFAGDTSVDFPILDIADIRFDGEFTCLSDKQPMLAANFKIATEYGTAENLRCHLDISGNEQLASVMRCGIAIETGPRKKYFTLLHGYASTADVDISSVPYSTSIPPLSTDPVDVSVYVWVDKTALEEVGVYSNNDMEISLVIY